MIGLIDRLEEKGMVSRQVDGNDRRYRYIRLTDMGRQYLNQSKQDAEAMDSALVRNFTQEEVAVLKSLLDKVYENISDLERGIQC